MLLRPSPWTLSVAMVVLAITWVPGSAGAQSALATVDDSLLSAPIPRTLQKAQEGGLQTQLIVGRVRNASGQPAAGAFVVSDAGGSAICAEDGSYRLQVVLPGNQQSLRLSAFGAGSSSGALVSRRLSLPTHAASLDAGEFTLTSGFICEPEWLPTFGAQPGTNGSVYDVLAFDDGSGPALFIGGAFSAGGGTLSTGLVRWNGTSWTRLGAGLDKNVFALAIFDDGQGGGPALYAAGSFQMAGGLSASRIARWDGESWSPLGSGIIGTVVDDLCVFDDGSGSKLYASGQFTSAGGLSAQSIASWDGTQWAPLGGGLDNRARTMQVWDDDFGQKLYVGGRFLTADGLTVNRMAAWDGASWSALGVGAGDGDIYAMTLHDDGSGAGQLLWIGGSFNQIGGVLGAEDVASWDGTSWTPIPVEPGGTVHSLLSWVDPNGQPRLLAGGTYSQSIKAWDGASWLSFDLGLNKVPRAMLVADLGGDLGTQLLVAGDMEEISTNATIDPAIGHMAFWDGAQWNAVDKGLSNQIDPFVQSATVFDDGLGAGPGLYVVGRFSSAGGQLVNNIARWDGSVWSDLGGGLTKSNPGTVVQDVIVHDDGTTGGPALYVSGSFTKAGGTSISKMARWNGLTWSPVGTGFGNGNDLEVWDDGSGNGPQLYMGGSFGGAGLVRWDGTSWQDIQISPSGSGTVIAMVVHDDGSGEALFVGGSMTFAGSSAVDNIARWDGVAWSPLGTPGLGPDDKVIDLAVVDFGDGPTLFVGGFFESPPGKVIQWDGSSWSPLGAGVDGDVHALARFDAGNSAGPRLFAGGAFNAAGGVPARGLAQWDGSAWSDVSGFNDVVVKGLVEYDMGDGPRLLAGGDTDSSPAGDSFVASYGVADPFSPWCDIGMGLAGISGTPLLAGSGSLAAGSVNQIDLTIAAANSTAAFFVGSSGLPVPFKGGLLVPSPVLDPLVLPTDLRGEISLLFALHSGIPTGSELWVQCAILDGSAIQGVALSNAIVGVAP